MALGIVKASLKILGIGIGVKQSGIAHVCSGLVPKKSSKTEETRRNKYGFASLRNCLPC